MQTPSISKLFPVKLVYEDGRTKVVEIKASKLEVAEARALKRNPGAKGVKR